MRRAEGPAGPVASAAGFRFAVVVSRFNPEITTALRDGARDTLRQAGAAETDVDEFTVPGAFELPQAARRAAEAGRYDAVICLGCVIRGDTPHFEYISSAAASGVMSAASDTGVPMAFGVLTTDTEAQALERARPDDSNKGCEAAAAAIEMAVLFRRLDRPAGRSVTRPSGAAGPPEP